MANNIYIGNRYVPVFANPVEWDNLRTYEALTIVTYLGTSYTSKIAVPVGIDLSNTTYWVVTGNFNSQVEQYRQDVVNYAGEVETYQLKVDEEIANRIASDTILDNKISTETNNRTEMGDVLDNKISTKAPKKRSYILIGDSFSVGVINSGTIGKGWIEHFRDMIGSKANVYYNTTAIPGVSGFASSLPFLTLLKGAEETFSNKNEITDIIVMGGTNDASVIASVPSAIQEFCLYVQANYPFAKLSIGVIGTQVQRNEALITAYKTCKQYGCNYITESAHLYCNPSYVSDGTHLTQEGYDFYAKYTNEIIQFGKTSYEFGFTYVFLGANGTIFVTEKGIMNWVGATVMDIPSANIGTNGGCVINNFVPPISLKEYTILGDVMLWEISENGVDIPRMVMSSTLYVSTERNSVTITGGLMYPWVKNPAKLYRYTYITRGFTIY